MYFSEFELLNKFYFMKRCHVGTGRKKTWVKSSRHLTLFLKERVSHTFGFRNLLVLESPWVTEIQALL